MAGSENYIIDIWCIDVEIKKVCHGTHFNLHGSLEQKRSCHFSFGIPLEKMYLSKYFPYIFLLDPPVSSKLCSQATQTLIQHDSNGITVWIKWHSLRHVFYFRPGMSWHFNSCSLRHSEAAVRRCSAK